jgi:hypothetical protein
VDCGCVRGAAAAAAKRGCRRCNRVTRCGGLLERIGLDCVWALKLLPCALCAPLLLLLMLLPPAAVLEYRMFAAEYSAARRGARPPHGEYERVFPERDAAGRGGAGVETRCAVAAVDGVRALGCACPCVYYCPSGLIARRGGAQMTVTWGQAEVLRARDAVHPAAACPAAPAGACRTVFCARSCLR